MPIRLRYIYRPFGKDAEIAATGMSPCGKYIVVGSGKTDLGTFIKFWRWSFAVDECDGITFSIFMKPNNPQFHL